MTILKKAINRQVAKCIAQNTNLLVNYRSKTFNTSALNP